MGGNDRGAALRLTVVKAQEVDVDLETEFEAVLQLRQRSASYHHGNSHSYFNTRHPPTALLNELNENEGKEHHHEPYLNTPTTANLNSLKILPRKNTDAGLRGGTYQRKLKKLSRRTEDHI
jgi:hypothetical protein